MLIPLMDERELGTKAQFGGSPHIYQWVSAVGDQDPSLTDVLMK
jgi:hypothetical protein